MVHTDKIVKELEISHEGVLDFKEFLHTIKDFFKRHNYDLTEKAYETKNIENLKNTTIKWEFDRKVDDYNQCFAKLKIELSKYKEGYVDSKKVVDGNIKITIEGDIVRDYDLKWKTAPVKKFMRAIYDKYIAEEKQDRIAKELKSIIENLRKEIKQYLNI